MLNFFIGPLVERLVSPAIYQWTREIDRNHVELTVPLVHAPLLSAGAAVLAGIGTNIITDVGDNTVTFWIGMLFICAGLIALAGGGAWLLRTLRTERPWLTKVRLELRHYTTMQSAPDDLPQARARVQRIRRVGERLIKHAEALTLRRWVRVSDESNARPIRRMWLVNLGAFLVIRLGLHRVNTSPPPPPAMRYLAIPLAIGLVALPIGLVLKWNVRRWWLRQLGAELVSEADRAEDTLRRLTLPPASKTTWARICKWWRRTDTP